MTPRTSALTRLAAAQTAGQAGTWAGYVAALPTALAQPHPAVAVAVITAAWGIPAAFARLAGGLVDRHGPRRTGATAWALAALAALVPVVTRPALPVLLAVLAVLALGGTWGVSAGEAAPTWLPTRPDPAAAGSWLALAANLTLIIGPTAASNLLACTSDQAAWALTAALSAAAALITLLIPATPPEPTLATPASQQPERDPGTVRAMLALTAGIYLTLGMITICEPLYVRQVLHAGIPLYGWLLATVGIAGILTSITASRHSIITTRWAVPAAALTLAAGEALYLNTTILACAFAGAAVFGTGTTLFRLCARTVIVRAVPPAEHGRALSGWESVQCIFFILPTAATGTLVTALGLRGVLRGCSALATVTATASLRPTRRTASYGGQPVIPPPVRSVSQPWRQPGPAELDPDRFRLPARQPAQYAGGTSRDRY